MDKIAEIKEVAEKDTVYPTVSWSTTRGWIKYLLSELELKESEYQSALDKIIRAENFAKDVAEENRQLREERDHWFNSAKHWSDRFDQIDNKLQSAQQEIERLNEELLHAK